MIGNLLSNWIIYPSMIIPSNSEDSTPSIPNTVAMMSKVDMSPLTTPGLIIPGQLTRAGTLN